MYVFFGGNRSRFSHPTTTTATSLRAGAKQSSHSVCKFILNFWIATKIFGVKININKPKSKFSRNDGKLNGIA